MPNAPAMPHRVERSIARVLAFVSIMAGAMGMLISFFTMGNSSLEIILCGGFGFVTGSILFMGGVKTVAQLSQPTTTAMLPALQHNHMGSSSMHVAALDHSQRVRRQHAIEHMHARHADLLQQAQALETRLIELEAEAEVDAYVSAR